MVMQVRKRTWGQIAERTTKDYEFFHRFHGGAVNGFSGAIFLLIYLVNLKLEPGILTAGLTFGLTLFWLHNKDALKHEKYGENMGGVANHKKAFFYWNLCSRGLLALITSSWVILNFLLGLPTQPTDWLTLLILVLVTPAMWRLKYSPIELPIVLILFAACAGASNGLLAELLYSNFAFLLWCAMALITLGIMEHLEFRRIQQRLEEL
jgi:hypothetical protein